MTDIQKAASALGKIGGAKNTEKQMEARRKKKPAAGRKPGSKNSNGYTKKSEYWNARKKEK